MPVSTAGRTDHLTSTDSPAFFQEVMQQAAQQSIVMQLFTERRLPKDVNNIPMTDALAMASWRNGDTGLAHVSSAKFKKKTLSVDDLDCWVMVPNTVLADAEYDIESELIKQMGNAIARKIDETVFLGGVKNIAAFPSDIRTLCTAASAFATRGTATAANGGLSKDISDVMAKVEAAGFEVTGFGLSTKSNQYLRNVRDTTGQSLAELRPGAGSVYGLPLAYGMKGMLGNATGQTEMIAVDGGACVLGIRSDIDLYRHTEGVIQDENGNTIFNLMQQKGTAFCMTIRAGWQYADYETYNALGTNEVQTVTIGGTPTGGTFSLEFTSPDGRSLTTKPIAYNATAAVVQAAIQAIGTVGRDNVSVTLAGAVYTVTFLRELGGQNVNQMTAVNALTGGTSPSVTIATGTAGVKGTPLPFAELRSA